ncbi:hypothetical protein DEU38_111107 [Rhodococcus sp. AG1013]|uniref:hypothetical protein n=1 Tax=Rhodococcus sp. AG1013 TaxID=2183996 RepID=UPI000E0A1D38|nr:hypothetical protein [Rhodococcus sp. AG1013]RDI24030.1 hypothetical protein DEU38_111107 [Rhodococcus sp. AG1013]
MSDGQRSAWQELVSAVDGGTLYLEPGVADACAGRCEDLMAALSEVRARAAGLSVVEGFGDQLPSGIALARKFGLKASGGDYPLEQAISDHIEVVREMQMVFQRIGAQYQAAEDANQQSLTNVDAGF